MLWLILTCLLYLSGVNAEDDSAYNDTENFFKFITRPDIGAPKWDIQVYDRDALQPGYYWFIGPYASLDQVDFPLWNGPHIYDSNGELIWSGAPFVKYVNTFDFRMSEVNGQQMLSFVWPKNRQGNGWILDNTYQLHTIVDMVGNHSRWNMHEFNLIDDGTRALMGFPQDYSATRVNNENYTGPCKIGWQGFKEVDVNTGEVYFEFNTQGHIDPAESNYVPKSVKTNTWEDKCATDWDITHINAVDRFDDGDYLFSARHTDALYKVSHKDHSIVWRLGGLNSDFEFIDQRARFTRQHHARFRGQNDTHILLSLFDNAVGSGNLEEESSSGSWGLHIALRIDTTPMTAELVARFEKPRVKHEHDYSQSRGSVSFLPNGNAFVGWVTGSHISEHAPDGRLLMTAILNRGEAATYRSYKMPWVGRPADPPDVVANAMQRRAGNDDLSTVIHVSWNGDTEVRTWNVLHTNVHGNISQLAASSPRDGFETTLRVDGFAKHVIAVGLDSKGEELGRSKVVTVVLPPDLQSFTLAHDETQWIKNHSSSWWEASAVKEAAGSFGKVEWFIIGFVVCVLICCTGLGLWLRRRSRQQGSWWRSQTTYKSVDNEDEMDQREWMLDEKEEDEDEDEDRREQMKTDPSFKQRSG